MAIFYFARCVRKIALYSEQCCLKSVIAYLARDIPAFVMYFVNGESGSSLLIESVDSMIIILRVNTMQKPRMSVCRIQTFQKRYIRSERNQHH